MRTFDASIRSSTFWLAVILPPVGYWTVVQLFAHRAGDGAMSVSLVFLIVALANLLPLAALGWMLCSVAAYTIAPGRLVEHRVVRDREFRLDALIEEPRCDAGVIILRLPRRTLHLRVDDPEPCLALLRETSLPANARGRR